MLAHIRCKKIPKFDKSFFCVCAYNVYPKEKLAEHMQKFTRGVQKVLETLLFVPGGIS